MANTIALSRIFPEHRDASIGSRYDQNALTNHFKRAYGITPAAVDARRERIVASNFGLYIAALLGHFSRKPENCREEPDVPENESYELRSSIPIIRVFRARAKPGCEKALAEKLATSSIEVVQGQPGFLGYLVAGPASDHQRGFIFASIWADADAVKARFGEGWRVSHLPPGYAELIEECSVDHCHLTRQSFALR